MPYSFASFKDEAISSVQISECSSKDSKKGGRREVILCLKSAGFEDVTTMVFAHLFAMHINIETYQTALI